MHYDIRPFEQQGKYHMTMQQGTEDTDPPGKEHVGQQTGTNTPPLNDDTYKRIKRFELFFIVLIIIFDSFALYWIWRDMDHWEDVHYVLFPAGFFFPLAAVAILNSFLVLLLIYKRWKIPFFLALTFIEFMMFYGSLHYPHYDIAMTIALYVERIFLVIIFIFQWKLYFEYRRHWKEEEKRGYVVYWYCPFQKGRV